VTTTRFAILLVTAVFLYGCSSGQDSHSIEDSDGDTVSDTLDCAPGNSNVWSLAQYTSVDLDGDGVRVSAAGEICSGDLLPAGYFNDGSLIVTTDCDDSNHSAWRKVLTYEDIDSDGVGSGSGILSCIGIDPPSGFSLYGYDPVDTLSDPDSAAIADFDLPAAITASAAYLEDGDDDD